MCAAVLTSCQTAPLSTSFPNEHGPAARVTLASGDTLKVVFSGAPELNQEQKIAADGRISLPQVGQVTAAGKSISQLQAEISGLYKSQLQNSEVLVILQSGATKVFLSGAVKKPGPVVLERPTTVLQAIMQAGGPNEFANLSRVQVIRLVNGRELSQTLDLRPTLAGQVTRPFYVREGDVISIGQKPF